MFAQEELIIIREIPTWTLAPFGVALVAAMAWVIRWILRPPEAGRMEGGSRESP